MRAAIELQTSTRRGANSVVDGLKASSWALPADAKLGKDEVESLVDYATRNLDGVPREFLGRGHATVQQVLDGYVASGDIVKLRDALGAPHSSKRLTAEQCILAFWARPETILDVNEMVPLRSAYNQNVYGVCYQSPEWIRVDLVGSVEKVVSEAAGDLVRELARVLMDDSRPLDFVTYRPVEISLNGVVVRTGNVRNLKGRMALARSIVFSGPGKVYYGAGVALIAASAFLRLDVDATIVWLNGLLGNLAAGFVGAGLVDSAVRFNRSYGNGSRLNRRDRRKGTAIIEWAAYRDDGE